VVLDEVICHGTVLAAIYRQFRKMRQLKSQFYSTPRLVDDFLVSTRVVSVVMSRDDTRQVYFPRLDFRFQHWEDTDPSIRGMKRLYLFGSAGSTIADSLLPGSVTR